MKMEQLSSLRAPSCYCSSSYSNLPLLIVKPTKVIASCGERSKHKSPSKFAISVRERAPTPVTLHRRTSVGDGGRNSRFVITGAVSLGILLILIGGLDDHNKAWALGPEGPLVEEFWDNVRRYGLYALTVSTGAIYTIVQPILELLKNPFSAILVIAILGGSFYIVSQVLSAMVGVTDFSYQYAN